MALDWKPTSQWWYARFGDKTPFNLNVKIEGRRPAKIHDSGHGVDPRFIKSRQRALDAHNKLRDERDEKGNQQRLLEKLIEVKTGSKPSFQKLSSLADAWKKIPRNKPLSEDHQKNCVAILDRFVAFLATHAPKVEELAQVSAQQIADFMGSESDRGISPGTWNQVLLLMRTVFRHFQPEAEAYTKYLRTTPKRAADEIHRRAFSSEQILKILEAARVDAFVGPLIITGLFTAMRRGDVCNLKWTDVHLDLKSPYVRVRTRKVKAWAEVPMFPPLVELLRAQPRTESPFVFPQQQEMYARNKHGITYRVKKLLMCTLFPEPEQPNREGVKRTREIVEEYLAERRAGIERLTPTTHLEELQRKHRLLKQERMEGVLRDYLSGRSNTDVINQHAITRATFFNFVNEVEAATKTQVFTGRREKNAISVRLRNDSTLLREVRTDGKRRASVFDFHAFRATFVTLALTRGVPLELVRRVTGHKTVDVVLDHYFQPGREDFREALKRAMPSFFVGADEPKGRRELEEIKTMLETADAKALAQVKAVLLQILASATSVQPDESGVKH